MNELVSTHWDKVQVQSNGVSVLGTYAPCRAALQYCCMFFSVGLEFNHAVTSLITWIYTLYPFGEKYPLF